MIGYGVTVRNDNVQTLWIYTAPYDEATQRIVVNSVNDVHILLQNPTPAGAQPGNNIEMVIRTFDRIDQVEPFRRTFVTGIGASVSNDNIQRLGMRITTIQ